MDAHVRGVGRSPSAIATSGTIERTGLAGLGRASETAPVPTRSAERRRPAFPPSASVGGTIAWSLGRGARRGRREVRRLRGAPATGGGQPALPAAGPVDPRTGQLLREHLRAPRGWHRIEDRDPPARTPPKTLALLAAAKRAGPAISTICDHIHRHDGAAGVRRILGVLSLARKHGPAVAEEAANAALELGVPTYRFLRRYLDRRPAAPLSLRQVDPLIRQLTLYRDLIDRRTGDPS